MRAFRRSILWGVLRLIEGLGPDAKVALPALLEFAGKAREVKAGDGQHSTSDLVDAIEDLRQRLGSGGE
jgi:hypothetical protein